MKANVILVALALAVVGALAPAVAQTDAEQPAKTEQLRQQFLEERANILSQILEKRAELVRISAQKDPDVKEVQRIVKEISELRAALREKCAQYRDTAAALGLPAVAPSPRLGAGQWGAGPRCWYDPRLRAGQAGPPSVRAWGRETPGFGPGRPSGAPWGGPRRGRAQGPAVGPRQAAPWGEPRGGLGQGPAFGPGSQPAPWVAARRQGAPGPGFGRFGGGRMGGRGVQPWGPGPFFTDKDNNGLCDYWEGPESPPAPPVEKPADMPAE